MVNKKYVPAVLDIIERWVPDRSTRSALLIDLHDSIAAKKNTSFRQTMDALIDEHARRHLRPGRPV